VSDHLYKPLQDREHKVHLAWTSLPIIPSREREWATISTRRFRAVNTKFMASQEKESIVHVINLVFLARWGRW